MVFLLNGLQKKRKIIPVIKNITPNRKVIEIKKVK